jgi:hypothetical protein
MLRSFIVTVEGANGHGREMGCSVLWNDNETYLRFTGSKSKTVPVRGRQGA